MSGRGSALLNEPAILWENEKKSETACRNQKVEVEARLGAKHTDLHSHNLRTPVASSRR